MNEETPPYFSIRLNWSKVSTSVSPCAHTAPRTKSEMKMRKCIRINYFSPLPTPVFWLPARTCQGHTYYISSTAGPCHRYQNENARPEKPPHNLNAAIDPCRARCPCR